MYKFYVQLDSKNKVHTVCQLKGEITRDNLIEIPFHYEKLLGAIYKDGKFIKTEIDIPNLSAITFKWLKFDLEQGEYIEDTENTTPFKVDIAGQVVELPVGETLEVTAEDSFTIKTTNEGAGNDSKEVIIDEN